MRSTIRLLALGGALAALAAGMVGVPRHAAAQMVPAQHDRLAAELEAVRLETAKYRDPAEAERDGYVLSRIGMDFPLMGEHWVNRERLERPVDLRHPAVLQYVDLGGYRALVGVAYGHWQRPDEAVPEGFTGDEDVWHTHDLPEMVERLTRNQPWYVRWITSRRAARWSGPDGRTQLAMLHVWLWSPSPDGVFANYNPALPYIRAGLPPEWARPGDVAGARAIGLLAPDACGALIGRTRRLIRADRAQREALLEVCHGTASQIAGALDRGADGDALNRIAANAWLDLLESAGAILTPEQRMALGAMREGGPLGHGHTQ